MSPHYIYYKGFDGYLFSQRFLWSTGHSGCNTSELQLFTMRNPNPYLLLRKISTLISELSIIVTKYLTPPKKKT